MKNVIVVLLFFVTAAFADSKIIYGYVEKATIIDKNLTLAAKLDTGAKTASLSAVAIKFHKENGKQYLTFTIPAKQGDVKCKAEYIGKANIKPRMGEYLKDLSHLNFIKRPVVKMNIRLGTKEREIRVNLTNRKRFNYPMLLGREAIVAFDGLVDPGHTFLLKLDEKQA